jgi:hypothetical protein
MNYCVWCGADVHPKRWALGYNLCLVCGDEQARQDRNEWCVVPMHKSNYFLCTDRADLKGINNKGGLVR